MAPPKVEQSQRRFSAVVSLRRSYTAIPMFPAVPPLPENGGGDVSVNFLRQCFSPKQSCPPFD